MNRLFPKGIQTFSDIRTGNYYYVDKTPLIIELTKEKYVFLSRPRRFGKSLTLDTLAELFKGNKTLFVGLYAENNWDWNSNHPVIRLSFVEGIFKKQSDLEQEIHSQIGYNEKNHQLANNDKQISSHQRFRELIHALYEKHQRQVVILIDEYDKPILDNLHDTEQAILIRDKLRDLYSVIKGQDANIRFAMLTGVSKFSKVNLFSGLNNLTDITLNEKFSALCGYTQQELESIFAPELAEIDLSEVKRWYNGYNWTGESVYNPYDVMLFLESKRFDAYWIDTGSSAFLMDLLFNQQVDITQILNSLEDNTSLSHFEVGDISPTALMFQTGYLTIDKTLNLPYGFSMTLKVPNIEVQQSLNQDVLRKYLHLSKGELSQQKSALYRALVSNDLEGLLSTIKSFFAGIPYNWHTNNNIAHFEGYWASVFYAYFASIGLNIQVEEPTSQGRMDMTVFFENRIYIFEFKVLRKTDTNSLDKIADKALQQIKEKAYADKYQTIGKQIYQIGMAFDEVNKGISYKCN